MNQDTARQTITTVEEGKQLMLRRVEELLTNSIAVVPFKGHREDALDHVAEMLRLALDQVFQGTLDEARNALEAEEIASGYMQAGRQIIAALHAESQLSQMG